MREKIQNDKRRNVLTWETVSAFEVLHLTDDSGVPLYPADHHKLWLALMTDDRIKRLCIIAPPESAKTTLTLAYISTYIGFWPERSVIIASVSGTIAEKRSLSLRGLVESEEYQETFSDVRPVKDGVGLRWEMSAWSLGKDGKADPGKIHPTVSSYGAGGSVIGARADLILADDLLDFDSARTEHQRELTKEWFHTSLLSRQKSNTGRTIVIGTSWHKNDLIGVLRDDPEWMTCWTPLMSNRSDGFYSYLRYPQGWKYPMMGEPFNDGN